MEILINVFVMAGIGAVIGGILAYAAKKFEVKIDPTIEEIVHVLPGVNCGGCGFPGCYSYAEAIAGGKVSLQLCSAGGTKVIEDISDIMGIEKVPMEDRKVARVICGGSITKTRKKYDFKIQIKSCANSNLYFGGDKSCGYGCLGYGDCVKVCPFDAVKINKDGISKVIEEKCTACGKCVSACPKNIIRILPFKSKHTVLCSSKEKGIVAKKMCEVSCIACGICAKNCPENAIIVENNLAKIDFIKCKNCGICKTKCPTKAIEGI